MSRPEDQAREHIDAALDLAGWAVQDRGAINLDAARSEPPRERLGSARSRYPTAATPEHHGAHEAPDQKDSPLWCDAAQDLPTSIDALAHRALSRIR